MIKKILFTLAFIALTTAINSQEKSDSIQPFIIVENMPQFKGGLEGLNKYLTENLKYPQVAAKKNITGSVYVSFIVTDKGKIASTKIIRGVDTLLNAEALRVIREMPDWVPGTQGGKAVNVSYTQKINFILPNNYVVTQRGDTIYGKVYYEKSAFSGDKVWLNPKSSKERSFYLNELKTVVHYGEKFLVIQSNPTKKSDKEKQLCRIYIQDGENMVLQRVVGFGTNIEILNDKLIDVQPNTTFVEPVLYLFKGDQFIDKYSRKNYKEVIEKYFTSCPRFSREVKHNKDVSFDDINSLFNKFCNK